MTLKQKVRDFSLHRSALRAFGRIALAGGLVGSFIQRSLGVGAVANSELWQMLQDSNTAMGRATIALMFQALEACAVPIYVSLLVEGANRTSSYKYYFLRVLLFFWGNLFRVSDGACCVILAAVLWALRDRDNFRNLAGAMAMVGCSIFSPFYLVGALGFLPVYFYEDELKPKCNRHINYLSYPVLLLIFWLVSLLVG